MFLIIEPLTTRGGRLRKTTNNNTQKSIEMKSYTQNTYENQTLLSYSTK